jgi:carboxypeptidase family protein/TonB-dependent receptor-like protein
MGRRSVRARGIDAWPELLLPAVLILTSATLAGAQAVKGSLLGNVTDAAGLAMPGATVTITETATNISYTAVTNESGFYTFSNLKDGTYRVVGELSGFKKTVRDGVIVPVNATIRVDLRMEIGALEETITVVGQSPLLQTDRADTSRVIEAVHLQEVPLGFNRNFQGMMITVPGALRLQRPHSDFFNAQDSLSTNVNGQSRLANNVQIEGIDDNHRTGLLTTLIPSAEAIETVNISTSAYDAEFGRAGGAITNVTLKSGTNDFKGSVFAFGNNEKTNAPGYFTHTKPPGDYLQSGFTLGGPLQRNRLFFFGDYQHIRDNAGRTTRAIIPPTAYRSGDFRASPTLVYDPLTGNADGTGRTPFPNNIVPADRISPIAKAILEHLPAPNIDAAPGQPNYQLDYARVKTTDSFDTKVNAQLNQSNQLSARLSFLRPTLTDPAAYGEFGDSKSGSPSGAGFAGTGTDTTYSTGVNYTRTWTNTLVMEARAGLNYFHNEALTSGHGLKTAEGVGIRGANIDEWTSGMTQIDFGTAGNQPLSLSTPMVGFSGSLPWDRSETTAQFATVFTKIAGNHTIKFGEDFRHTRDFLLQTQDNGGPRGQFQFRSAQTAIPSDAAATAGFANAFASFLLDVPSTVQRDLKVTDPGVRFWAFFSFVQDKWAVTPKLTIDLGLRHEYYTPFIGLVDQGGLSNYDPASNTLQVAGYGTVGPSVGVQRYAKNFGPRAGASYRLNDQTVLRGGYGVSTLPFPDNSYIYNYPVKQNNVFNAPNNFASAGSMKNGFPDPVFVQIPANGVIDAGTPALRNASYFHVKPDMHEGSLHSFNVAFQRELPARFTLDVAYVGNRGHDVQTQFNENAATVIGLPGNAGRPLFGPFQKSADVTTWIGTKTSYNSLQTKLDRRFSNGVLVTTSYTLGRGWSYVNGDSNSGIATPADIERSWARTDQDRLHSLVESFLVQLPFGPDRRWLRDGAASRILGGWQVSGIFTYQSGSPVSISMSAATLNAPGNTQRPDVSGTPKVLGDIGPGNLWFDTSVFSSPAANTFGNALRNGVLDGPSYVNLDATIAKLLSFYRIKGEVRADIFNITNTPHFNNPNGTYLGAGFGQITSTVANSERSMRFGVRLLF